MFSSLPEMNWTLIAMLLVVSAVVSFIGDIVGMRIGKKRISLFGLRPRYTSSLVTVVTGILIMLFTLGALAMTSDTVRTAIFSMKIVQSQIRDLTSQLQKTRDELASMEEQLAESQASLIEKQTQLSNVQVELEKARKERELAQRQLEELESERISLNQQIEMLRQDAKLLKEGLEELRAGRIVVFAGELIAQKVIIPAESDLTLEALTEDILAAARYMIALRTGAKPEEVVIRLENAGSIEEILEKSRRNNERVLLRLMASENVIVGQPVDVRVLEYPSELIYPDGTVLADEVLPAGLDEGEAEGYLYVVLREINKKVRQDGVLPDPLRGTVGNLEASDFFDAIEQIADSKEPPRVIVEAEGDIYTEGPVRVKIRVLVGDITRE